MKDFFKRFWREEDGMGTIEIIIIIAVLVAVALIFKTQITEFVTRLMNKFFNPDGIDVPYDGEPATIDE